MNLAPARPRIGLPVPARLVVGLLGAAAVVVVLVARPRRVSVEGPSMEPSLRGGDRLLVLRRPRPTAGDIVALEDPGTGTGTGTVAPLERPRQTRRPPRLIVKRVVSVAGDTVVVWGDNLASSTDSRVFGPVDRSAIVGRAVYRYFPPERSGRLR